MRANGMWISGQIGATGSAEIVLFRRQGLTADDAASRIQELDQAAYQLASQSA
jgi:hypothetical protein